MRQTEVAEDGGGGDGIGGGDDAAEQQAYRQAERQVKEQRRPVEAQPVEERSQNGGDDGE